MDDYTVRSFRAGVEEFSQAMRNLDGTVDRLRAAIDQAENAATKFSDAVERLEKMNDPKIVISVGAPLEKIDLTGANL